MYLGINVREARGARAGALHVRSASDRDERAGSAEKCLKETGCTCAAANRAGTGERQHGLRMRTAAACRPRPCFCRCSVKTALCAEACVCGREERRRVGVARGMMAGGVKVAPAIVLCSVPRSLSHAPLSAGLAQEDTAKGCTPRGGGGGGRIARFLGTCCCY